MLIENKRECFPYVAFTTELHPYILLLYWQKE